MIILNVRTIRNHHFTQFFTLNKRTLRSMFKQYLLSSYYGSGLSPRTYEKNLWNLQREGVDVCQVEGIMHAEAGTGKSSELMKTHCTVCLQHQMHERRGR
jgi:hypothetical protein